MSRHVVLIGATGLVGAAALRQAADFAIDITALARRRVGPVAPNVNAIVAQPKDWPAMIAGLAPDVVASALGTTWRKAGASEDAFRAVDQQLVLDCAFAGRSAGAERMITVSAAGANARSRNFYLRVKGEVEAELKRMGFTRLDLLRPGLLRGSRGTDRRVKERLAIAAAPFTDRLLRGRLRPLRSIDAEIVGRSILALSQRAGEGIFTQDGDAIAAAARTTGRIGG